MSAELIGILALGAALAGLILRGQHQTNKRLDSLTSAIDASMDGMLDGMMAKPSKTSKR